MYKSLIERRSKDETHAATNRGDTSPRLHCCCDKSLALILSLRYVARIQTSLNSCDRSQQQNSVAATMIFTCHTSRFVAAICREDVSQRVSRLYQLLLLGRCRTQYVAMITKLLNLYRGTHLTESYCKESNISDSNWLRYQLQLQLYLKNTSQYIKD